MVALEKLANEYRIDKKILYRILLWWSNKNGVSLLETEDSVYDAVYDEIVATKKYLLSEKFVWKPNNISGVVPIKLSSYLYFLYQGKDIVYIGQSCNLLDRISTHRRDKSFDSIACKEVPKRDLLKIETININYYAPMYNKVGIGDDLFPRLLLDECVFQECFMSS